LDGGDWNGNQTRNRFAVLSDNYLVTGQSLREQVLQFSWASSTLTVRVITASF
jgi:hypothetical protein